MNLIYATRSIRESVVRLSSQFKSVGIPTGDASHILGGEYLEACVNNWGGVLIDDMGIPGSRVGLDASIAIKKDPKND